MATIVITVALSVTFLVGRVLGHGYPLAAQIDGKVYGGQYDADSSSPFRILSDYLTESAVL
jgi:hypothetical protein